MCVLPVVCLLQQCPPWVGWLVQPQFPWVGWAVHTCTPAMTKYFGQVEEFDPVKEDSLCRMGGALGEQSEWHLTNIGPVA